MAARRRERPSTPGVVLDAGAFLALERRDGFTVRLLAGLVRQRARLVTSGGVVAQIWRGGAGRQAIVAMLLPQVEVVPLDDVEAKLVGMMLGLRRRSDVVDGHVAVLGSERRMAVLTSDPDDLLALDPRLDIIRV